MFFSLPLFFLKPQFYTKLFHLSSGGTVFTTEWLYVKWLTFQPTQTPGQHKSFNSNAIPLTPSLPELLKIPLLKSWSVTGYINPKYCIAMRIKTYCSYQYMRLYKEQNQVVSGLQVINLMIKQSVQLMTSFSHF